MDEPVALDEAVEAVEPVEEARHPRVRIGDLITQLVDDVRNLLRAEFKLYRAEAGRAALSAGWAAGMLVGAIVLGQGALVALLVGLVLLLAPLLGIGWAILAVVGGSLAVAALLGWLGVRKINSMIDPEKP